MKLRYTLPALAIGAVLLTGCATATQDRPDSAGGKEPDSTAAATQVTVYLNADNVPNVAFFCTGAIRWASTLSGGDSGKDKASTLVRIPEQDALCAGKPQ